MLIEGARGISAGPVRVRARGPTPSSRHTLDEDCVFAARAPIAAWFVDSVTSSAADSVLFMFIPVWRAYGSQTWHSFQSALSASRLNGLADAVARQPSTTRTVPTRVQHLCEVSPVCGRVHRSKGICKTLSRSTNYPASYPGVTRSTSCIEFLRLSLEPTW